MFSIEKRKVRSFLTHNIVHKTLALLPMSFRSSPRPISIGQLNVLPHLHLRPINHIVYVGSYFFLKNGKSYLRGDFTLRCLQRLFLPYLATQPCLWQDNWYTSGTSIRSSRTKDSSLQISCARDR